MISSIMSKYQKVIKNLPHKPGVYRFYDKFSNPLYIGKAKDLKNRISSYFQEGRPKNQRLTLMISQIDKIEYTVVENEKESIILEANLIHKLQPKYNILLKDDKSYIFVRITDKDEIPGVFLTRRKFDPESDYFGPYTKKAGISETLRVLRNIFPYCQERVVKNKFCPYVGLRQCDGICGGKENLFEYRNKIQQIKNVLKGKTLVAENFISQEIQKASQSYNYELAALWRDRLRLLKETVIDQKIILPQPQDIDLITIVIDQPTGEGLEVASVFVQNIREGKMINLNNFLLSGTEETIEDLHDEFKDSPEIKSNSLTQKQLQFAYRFLNSYYMNQTDDAPVMLEIYQSESD